MTRIVTAANHARAHRKADFTCGQLMDAALQIIAREGLHAASYARIAQQAGVVRGVIYYHFADRPAFLRALHAHVVRRRNERLAAVAQGPMGMRSPSALIDLYWGLLQEPPFRAHAELAKAAKGDPGLWAMMAREAPVWGLPGLALGDPDSDGRMLLAILACVSNASEEGASPHQPGRTAMLDYLKRLVAAGVPQLVTAA
ncbi:TetR/AcrR family transcriptional regulator [Phenylobacterium sp.]|uniref:TetR/AcrR family transcriptional regulator n=1 Tax=Phenylobacterium sp. TaxID=1871053 RepID=UPI0035AE9F24